MEEEKNEQQQKDEEVLIKLTVGDVVKLKSDGPEMTVQNVEEKHIACAWFNAAGELKRADIKRRLLIKI